MDQEVDGYEPQNFDIINLTDFTARSIIHSTETGLPEEDSAANLLPDTLSVPLSYGAFSGSDPAKWLREFVF